MYVVAIPTYNRVEEIVTKTLPTLLNGGINKSRIYIFVANATQEKMYEAGVPKNMYNKIIVGKKGIANQRKFIMRYFPEGQYVVSIDDDVEELQHMVNSEKMAKLTDVHGFFMDAYKTLKKEKRFLWGIYPVRNPFFMKKTVTTGLKFIIGVLHGYINRHSKHLEPSVQAESKEDYEMSILYSKMDGGVVRFNYITTKTKFNAEGGLGKDRQEMNAKAADYLVKKYPDIVSIFHRKTNGMTEVKLREPPVSSSNI
jgi:hypothetical protein